MSSEPMYALLGGACVFDIRLVATVDAHVKRIGTSGSLPER
jgi:hypothetical protein